MQMDRNHSTLKRYIRSISNALPCSGKTKKQIVSQIRESIDGYLLENPEADLATLQAHFGTPQQIASSYVDSQETSALLRKMRTRKYILSIFAGVMAIFLLIWSGVVFWKTVDTQKSASGQVEFILGSDSPS